MKSLHVQILVQAKSKSSASDDSFLRAFSALI